MKQNMNRKTLFKNPPVVQNSSGAIRRVGFEFEFASLDIKQATSCITDIFGGYPRVESKFATKIKQTSVGDFSVEIDTSLLKDKKYEGMLAKVGITPQRVNLDYIEASLLSVFSTVVPFEIATPPVPVTELNLIEHLNDRLRESGAKGTSASLFYAFGLHINPECASTEPRYLLSILRAFILLYPWIKKRVEVDISRKLSSFISPFPEDFGKHILKPDYSPDLNTLIEDYLEFNPSRNRPLDMLPIFAFAAGKKLKESADDLSLVKPRPAFHYRMPNCNVDRPEWTIAGEWNTWVAVEELAADEEKLARLSREFLTAEEHSFKPFYDKWQDMVLGYQNAES